MTSAEHLEKAEQYARPLSVEKDDCGDHYAREADQGQAMRLMIYHCTAAIVAAIDDHRKDTRR